MIPFDADFASRSAARVRRRRARRRARRGEGRDRRELPLRPQGAGRPAAAGRRPALCDGRAPAARNRRRDRLLEPHPRAACSPARSPRPAACSARASSSAARSRTATSAAASWASRPPTSSPTRRWCAPATASTHACRRPSRGGQHRRAPDLQTGRGELIEAYLLDFDGDLYGSELRLEFLARLRGERRFEDPQALIEQMHRDVERTREIAAEPHRRAAAVCYRAAWQQ